VDCPGGWLAVVGHHARGLAGHEALEVAGLGDVAVGVRVPGKGDGALEELAVVQFCGEKYDLKQKTQLSNE
jgi:hypothetical protein